MAPTEAGTGGRRGERGGTAGTGRFRRRLGLSALVLASCALALWLGRNRVLAPLALRLARPWLAEQGVALEVGRFTGSWTRSLVLEGVTARFERDGWRGRLELGRLALEGGLVRLARSGGQELALLERATLEGLGAELGREGLEGSARLELASLAARKATEIELGELAARSDLALWPEIELACPRVLLLLDPARISEGALELVRSLSLEAPRLRVDLAGERASASRRPSEERSAPAALSRWPALTVADATLELGLAQGGELALEELSLALPEGRESVELELSAGALLQRGASRERSWRALTARASWHERRLEVASLELGGTELVREAWIDFAGLEQGELELALTLSLYGGWAHLRGKLADERVQATVAARELSVGGLLALLDSEWAQGSRALVTFEGELELPLAEPSQAKAWISLRETDLELAGLALAGVRAEARIEEGLLIVSELGARMGQNRIVQAALRTPLEALELGPRLARSEGELELECEDLAQLSPELGERLGPGWRLGLRSRLAAGALLLEEGALEGPAGSARLRSGRLEFSLEDGRPRPEALALDLEARLLDLALLAGPLGLEGLEGSGAGSIALEGPLQAPLGQIELTLTDLALLGHELGRGELALELAQGELRIGSFEVDGPLGRARATGALELEPFAARELLVSAELLAPARLLPGWPDEGPLALEVLADGPLGALALAAALESPTGALEGAARLSLGEQDAWRLALDALHFEDSRGDLSLLAPATLVREGERLALEELRLEGSLGSLLASAELDRDLRRVALELERFELPAAVGALLPARLELSGASGHVALEERQSLVVDAELALERLRYGESPPLAVELRASLAEGRLELQRLVARTPERELLSAVGSLPFDPAAHELLGEGELALEAHFASPRLEELADLGLPALAELAGELELRLSLQGSWSEPRGTLALHGRDLAWRPRDAWRAGTQLGPAALGAWMRCGPSAEGAGGELTVSAHLDSPGQISSDIEGRIALPADARRLFGTGALGLPLELSLSLTADDLGFLQAAVPVVRRAAGRASAAFTLTGTTDSPSLRGEVKVEEALLRTTTALPSITALEIELALEDDQARLVRAAGELGGAPFELAGSFGPFSAEPQLRLSLRGERLLLYRLEGVRVRADADLAVEGPLHALALTGELGLRDGLYVRNVDLLSPGGGSSPQGGERGFLLFSLRSPPLSSASLDLRVSSTSPFRIKNNLADATLRPELRVSGSGLVPLVEGRILIDKSWISLPSGRLTVESGEVLFDPTDPFVPTVVVSARTRLRGYDVRVGLRGPYDRPELEFSSVPPLEPRELLPLVLAGTPPASGDAATVESTAQEVAVFLARDLAQRLFSTESTEAGESIAERIEFETGRDVTTSGSTTARISLRVADGVLARKDSLFLVGERDVYDKLNYGLRLLFRLR